MSVFVAWKDRPVSVQHISPRAIPLEDLETLEWLQYRTLRKTPGMFKSDFWDTLLLQASTTEPAIMHGVLALSSVHRCGVTLEIKSLLSQGNAGRLWTAGLQHYVEAINQLRRRVLPVGAQDRMTLRVVIIACLVFVCVELLRGQIGSAQAHLRSGMSLLREAGLLSQYDLPTAKALKSPGAVDRWIVEVFCRIHLHDTNFNLLFFNLPTSNHGPTTGHVHYDKAVLPPRFTYMEEAWASVDRLLLAAVRLTQDCKTVLAAGKYPRVDISLRKRREQLRTDLAQWSNAFHKSSAAPFKIPRGVHDQSPALIQISLDMATILIETSLDVSNEMIYDNHNETFLRLLDSTTGMLRIHREQSEKKTGTPSLHMSFTIFDICTLPVLYFTATRCRVPGTRLRALAGLSRLRHRERHWDGWLTYAVAKKIVELEEQGACGVSSLNVAAGATVPASSRLWQHRIVTVGDPFSALSVEFERQDINGDPSAHKVDLDIRSGVWSDEVHGVRTLI
ncbi:hypothetical protein NLU13_5719 [Sarocladium strictum]|uniref:C6 zinc finger domain protein n=1 Tax=Sarocladium strictum TaxID=5046 RepID=A0AA39L7X0_SARSR|nr:hypothetical protein NLU13_5719 [Sarocladium strictum]